MTMVVYTTPGKGFVPLFALVFIVCTLYMQANKFMVTDLSKDTQKTAKAEFQREVIQTERSIEQVQASAVEPEDTNPLEEEDYTAEMSEGNEWTSDLTNVATPQPAAGTVTMSNSTSKSPPLASIVPKAASQREVTTIHWKGVPAMDNLIKRFWKGNLFCETIQETKRNSTDVYQPITLNITFGCEELFKTSEMGTGNFISVIYGIRLATHFFENVDVHYTCFDAYEQKDRLIMPWITGYFPPNPQTIGGANHSHIGIEKACGNYDVQPIAHMYREIQYDLRRMAIGLVGIPHASHPSAVWAKEYLWSGESRSYDKSTSRLQLPLPKLDALPPFPGNEYVLDDAVIHFRCGDLMVTNHPSFGFMKFSGYTRHISPEARTIGIVTQPFDTNSQSRPGDASNEKRRRCKIVVLDLVEYIQERWPNAAVQIHNGPNETIALAYARMVMANQTVVGISSFGVFPIIASFGTGYVRLPDYRKAPNKFMIDPHIDTLTDNVVLIPEKMIFCGRIKRLWQSEGAPAVLHWFRNDTLD